MAALLITGYAYTLWVLFLAVMALKHAWDSLPMIVKVLAAPAVLVAYLLDVGLNLLATIPFADSPEEWTFSRRMGRYKRSASWRTPVAGWLCANLLDPFDIGGHCHA